MASKTLKTLQFAGSEDVYELTPEWESVENRPDMVNLSVTDDGAGAVSITQQVLSARNGNEVAW